MRESLLNFSLFIVALVFSGIVISPQARLFLARPIQSQERIVLATIFYSAENDHYKVVKLQVGSSVVIEIFKILASSNYSLMSFFEIPDSRDVFYDLNSTPTNLFTTHLDSEGAQEIVVPTMDKNFVSRLNIIKFNSSTKTFAHHKL